MFWKLKKHQNYQLEVDSQWDDIGNHVIGVGTHVHDMGAHVIDMGKCADHMGTRVIDMGAHVMDTGTHVIDMVTRVNDMGTHVNNMGAHVNDVCANAYVTAWPGKDDTWDHAYMVFHCLWQVSAGMPSKYENTQEYWTL